MSATGMNWLERWVDAYCSRREAMIEMQRARAAERQMHRRAQRAEAQVVRLTQELEAERRRRRP